MSTIEDLDFPKAVLTRLIKGSLPENIAIQKDARQSVAKAATVFVSYLAATANDCARESGHKTIMTNDVFKALEAVGLSDFIERLQIDFAAHTALMKEKKETAAKNRADGIANNADGEDDEEEEETMDDGKDDDEEVGGEPKDDSAVENSIAAATAETAPVQGDVATISFMDVDDGDDENVKRQRID
ncbi:hypothetical protein GGI25_005583 [Coemansia spiralis]|uniref:DNA polymerase epsilon subunit D n=2 Tax=Coemansia TaxID=4863 RepID=A0A9W8G4G4_9FUNG|nr:histone-fold-containing protein [Coemansia spiralis]KAJ1987799.1 hypothetical protein EDC05_005632 [Coemansia umbellata]KAJ2619464.1 hypothetical protein GGI26_005829 [Coemansia sp. RSA 1358]KAJ2671218.1 hypothetical protein GGI25_005583 [Coemansia spiralis]